MKMAYAMFMSGPLRWSKPHDAEHYNLCAKSTVDMFNLLTYNLEPNVVIGLINMKFMNAFHFKLIYVYTLKAP